MSSSSLRIVTRIFLVLVVGLFALTELVVVLAFREIPSDHLFPGLGTKYWIVLIAALPMIAGLNGYYSVRRRLSSASDEVTSVLSLQFLFTIVTAYAALLICVGAITQTLRHFLR